MSDASSVLVILLVIGAAFVIRRMTGRFDYDRIREYIERGGGKVLDIKWNRFGPGWLGSGSERIYEVRYTTRHGKTCTGTCKTGMFSGVYWTGDAPPSGLAERSGPIACLKCGSEIPAECSHCPMCGWSFVSQ